MHWRAEARCGFASNVSMTADLNIIAELALRAQAGVPGAEVPFSSAYAAPMPPAPQPGAAHAASRDFPMFHHAGAPAGGYHGGGLSNANPGLNPSLAGLPNGAGGPYYGSGPAGGLHFGGGLQFGSLAPEEAATADPVVPNPGAGAGGDAGARGTVAGGGGMNADPSVHAPPPQHAGHARGQSHGSIAPPAQAPPTSTASLAQVRV